MSVSAKTTEALPGVRKNDKGQPFITASAYRNLTHQLDKLSLLMEVSKNLMAEITLESLLELVMSSVTKVMSADRSTLYIVDKENRQLWSKVAQGAGRLTMPLNHGLAGHVAQTGETLNIKNAYQDARFNREFDENTGYVTKNMLCMAVKDRQSEIIAVIQVLNRIDGTHFNQEDEDMLRAFCALAGISLTNAKAYDELASQRDVLEIKVKERTKDLAEAKGKTDDLLRNILPVDIAEQLIATSHAIPRRYESATVVFADFKGFTGISEKMTPEVLVQELDYCFLKFDEIVDKYGLEKIKTIGDSYMFAGGVPKQDDTHAIRAILASLEIVRFIGERKADKESVGQPYWGIRIGIHSGPVVDGVVGKRRFAYDIWGDTVNTASHMESASEPGRINISQSTFKMADEYILTTYRGKVAAKNKGEIDMYFVESLKPEWSLDGDGNHPTGALLSKINIH